MDRFPARIFEGPPCFVYYSYDPTEGLDYFRALTGDSLAPFRNVDPMTKTRFADA